MDGINWSLGKVEFHGRQTWTEWFKRTGYNWREFTFIHAYYEDEVWLGQREIAVGLLGFTLRASWTYDKTAEGRTHVETLLKEHGLNDEEIEDEEAKEGKV